MSTNNLSTDTLSTPPIPERLASARVPTPHGEFHVCSYRSAPGGGTGRERTPGGDDPGEGIPERISGGEVSPREGTLRSAEGDAGAQPTDQPNAQPTDLSTEHMACVLGDPASNGPALVRIHSECATGDLLGSLRCDCGEQLQASLRLIAEEGEGVLLYLRSHEGRGVGLARKFKAYALQDEGADTVDANLRLGLPADGRNYALATAILTDLGIRSVRLLTNNLDKVAGLLEHGVSVVERIPLQTEPNPENLRYLTTKRDRLGHLLEGLDEDLDDEAPSGAPQSTDRAANGHSGNSRR